jgi:DNA-directed RNA polymerase sigma subunit (sigma70/sigma32)
VSCRYNLYLDVREDGGLKLNFPDKEPDEITASCALDLAEDGSRTLDGIAALMGMSKERARQLEARGLGKMRDGLPRRDDVTRLDDTDWI